MAVRWNNVQGRDGTRGAALALMAANQAAGRMFDSGKGVINDFQKGQDNRYAYQKTQNDLGAQKLLSSYKTPEEMQAARDDGSFASQLGAFGSNINPEYGLTGAQSRITNLRAQQEVDETYRQTQATLTANPYVNSFEAAQAGNDVPALINMRNDPAAMDALSSAGLMDNFNTAFLKTGIEAPIAQQNARVASLIPINETLNEFYANNDPTGAKNYIEANKGAYQSAGTYDDKLRELTEKTKGITTTFVKRRRSKKCVKPDNRRF